MLRRSLATSDLPTAIPQPSLRRKRAPLGEASPNALVTEGTGKMQDDRPSKIARLSSSTSLARPLKRRLRTSDEARQLPTHCQKRSVGTDAQSRPISLRMRPPTPPRPHQPLEPADSPPKQRRQSMLPISKSSFSLDAFKSDLVAPSPVPAMFAPSPAPIRNPVRRLDFSQMPSQQPRKLPASPQATVKAPILDADHNPFAVPAFPQRSLIPTTPGGRRILGGISKFGQSPAPNRSVVASPAVSREPPTPTPGLLLATPKRVLGGISKFGSPMKASPTATRLEDVEMVDAERSVSPVRPVQRSPVKKPVASTSMVRSDTIHPPALPTPFVAAKDTSVNSESAPLPKPRALSRATSQRSLAGPSDPLRTRPEASSTKTEIQPPTLSALPAGPRRPLSRPVNAHAPASVQTENDAPTGPSLRRRPSYPSSLGLGAGPSNRKLSNSRVVSNPITSRSMSGSGPTPAAAPVPTKQPTVSPRSVSAPIIKPRASLSMSSRREGGFSSEANKSFVHLDELLSKLQMKPDRPTKQAPGSMGPPPKPAPLVVTHRSRASMNAPAHSRLSMQPSTEDPDASIKASTLEALMASKHGNGCLRGLTAFVDVRTEDNDDVSMLYVEILKQCGARVLVRPSESCTHIIYKSGKSSTLAWWRKQRDPKPYIVGAGWVTKCKEEGRKVAEEPYAVQVEDECMFQKRRKSMEPKQLALMTAGNLANTSRGNIPEAYASSLAQARRASLLYAPRVSSPLKKAFKSSLPPSSEDET